MTSPLIVPIAEALEADWNTHTVQYTRSFLADGATAADACIAVIAALPADYTAVDVLAFLRGDDVPSEPLPVKRGRVRYDCCAHCTAEDESDDHVVPCTSCGQGGAA